MENQPNDLNVEIAKEVVKQLPVKDLYEGLAKPSIDSSGQLIGLIPRAINAALSPLHQWILHSEYNIAATKILLEKKLEKIDPDKIVQPEPFIAVPAIQAISYCQDNEILRDMYANLLSSSMNQDIKNEVHPSYVELIKQLSPDEAKILSVMYVKNYEPFISLRRNYKNQEGGVALIEYFTYIGIQSKCELQQNIPSYLENLDRLKLIEIVKDSYLTAPGIYDSLINHEEIVKYTSLTDDKYSYSTEKMYIRITNYGKSFCKICI